MKSISGAEQNVNRCLPSDLGNKVRPTSGKWAVSKRYPMPMRAKYAEIVALLYLERDIEHIWSGWDQLDINFKSAVLDRALHDNLRYWKEPSMNEIRLRSPACVSSTWRNEYLSDVLVTINVSYKADPNDTSWTHTFIWVM